MIEVALEASGRPGSVAARRADKLLAVELGEEAAHASDLLIALDQLVRELDGHPSDVSAIFVGTGPGSFTGLRVAIATAQGMALGTNAELRSVCSFEAFMFGSLEVGEEAFVVSDAFSSELYLAQYRREESEVSTLTAPHVVPAGPLELPSDVRVFGDAKGLRAAELEEHARALPYSTPSARHVLELGAVRLAEFGREQPDSVEPLYLRPFAAKKRRR